MAPLPRGKRRLQLVVYGATGFTGKLAVQYLVSQYGGPSSKGIRWGIAGRSRSKLEAVAREQGEGKLDNENDIIVADAGDSAALQALVEQTDVVISCAGPFSRYGSLLVAECSRAGTDYCDITGEIPWVREMIAAHDDEAQRSGARIVHLCGHDSVPWDLSTLALANKLKEKNPGEELARVDFFDDINGSASGGTLETAIGLQFGKDGKTKSAALRSFDYDVMLKPHHGTGPSDHRLKAKNIGFLKLCGRGEEAHRSMFVMSGVNANAVKRSNALNKYGAQVTYCEGQQWKTVFSALCFLATFFLFGLSLAFPPTRWFMRTFVLPKPGEGPSEEAMAKGYLNIKGIATGVNGTIVRSEIRFPVDPGYKDTARMIVESGLALALESHKIQCNGGVLTPAACQGKVLLDRLVQTGTAFTFY